ncbi:glycerol-3-phosphate 1-O-acyltransferase PlsY [Sulfurimonas sp. MAG313]|nr:glycerol-3-phosphate 1-O-acyltransferase PlsY [Sulfurimonas sp. MAG313]MDF1880989.1 glycerol-3-phosphate 1-O-acyltransferase PlsY [Sulfurimonas sp. MAG313]
MEFLFNINGQFYLAAYLIGSIPFGLLLAKFFAGVDIKKEGSQSIGATNVLRVVKEKDPKLAKKLGAMTLILDALKGLVVLTLAILMQLPESTLWGIAVLAVVGHCFSLYLWFEGGKGVATALGVLILMLPLETAIALLVWAFMAKVVKISSLSSLVALVALVLASFILHPEMFHAPLLLIGFIVVYKHIPNIIRLFKGAEKKVI